ERVARGRKLGAAGDSTFGIDDSVAPDRVVAAAVGGRALDAVDGLLVRQPGATQHCGDAGDERGSHRGAGQRLVALGRAGLRVGAAGSGPVRRPDVGGRVAAAAAVAAGRAYGDATVETEGEVRVGAREGGRVGRR